jgi:hypothetical protein
VPSLRSRTFFSLAASVLLLFGLVGCGREGQQGAATSTRPARWEYRSVGAKQESLRAAGQDGWEAFATDKDEHGDTIMWLKRPLAEGNP